MSARRLPPLLLFLVFVLSASPRLLGGDEQPEEQAWNSWKYYNNMGWMAFQRGDLDVARSRFSMAIDSIRPHQKAHLGAMARSYHDLSRVLCAQKRFAEAEPLAKWAAEAREHVPLIRQDALFDSVYLVAVIERELHKDAESILYFARAVKIEEANVGSNSPQLALTIKEMADAEARVGDLAGADAHYVRAIQIHEAANPDAIDLANVLVARAAVLDRLGRGDDARAAEARAQEIRVRADEILRRSRR